MPGAATALELQPQQPCTPPLRVLAAQPEGCELQEALGLEQRPAMPTRELRTAGVVWGATGCVLCVHARLCKHVFRGGARQ